jgi:hypothetical protein
MLLFSPMLIGSLSPRAVAFHQMEALLARRTSPMTMAVGATQLSGSICGWRLPMAKMGMGWDLRVVAGGGDCSLSGY